MFLFCFVFIVELGVCKLRIHLFLSCICAVPMLEAAPHIQAPRLHLPASLAAEMGMCGQAPWISLTFERLLFKVAGRDSRGRSLTSLGEGWTEASRLWWWQQPRRPGGQVPGEQGHLWSPRPAGSAACFRLLSLGAASGLVPQPLPRTRPSVYPLKHHLSCLISQSQPFFLQLSTWS